MDKISEILKEAVANLGEEEKEQLRHTVLTRADTQAEADVLFGVSPAARVEAAKEVDKLFVQAKVSRKPTTSSSARDAVNVPAPEPKHPELASEPWSSKTASVKTAKIMGEAVPGEVEHVAVPYKIRREAYKAYLAKKAKEEPSGYLKGIAGGTGIGALTGAGIGALEGLAATGRGHGALMGAAVGGGIGAIGGGLLGGVAANYDKKEIKRAKELAGKNGKHIDRDMGKRVAELADAREARQQSNDWNRTIYLKHASADVVKTAAIDAFFEENLSVYARYPELLKVAGAASAIGSSKLVQKPKVTEVTGPTPVKSSLSGGAA